MLFKSMGALHHSKSSRLLYFLKLRFQGLQRFIHTTPGSLSLQKSAFGFFNVRLHIYDLSLDGREGIISNQEGFMYFCRRTGGGILRERESRADLPEENVEAEDSCRRRKRPVLVQHEQLRGEADMGVRPGGGLSGRDRGGGGRPSQFLRESVRG